MAFSQDDVVLAARLKAMAHPARLAIIRALWRDGCRCGDIVRALPLAQSTVSEHLRILRDAGLIHGEANGPRSCYRLDSAAFASVRAEMAAFEEPKMFSSDGIAR